MIYGIGTDIIEIERIEKSLTKTPTMKDRLFHQAEQDYCEDKTRKYEHYAARFAAKEAFLKALGTGLRDGLAFHEIVVMNNKLGAPSFKLIGKSKEIVESLNLVSIKVSMSHVKETAIAFVVIER